MSSIPINTCLVLNVNEHGLTRLPKLDTRQPSLVRQGRRALDMGDVMESQGCTTLYTVTDAMRVLRVSRWMINGLIRDNKLKSLKIGTRRLIAPDDLVDFIKQCKETGS